MKKNHTFHIFILLALLFLSACKKDPTDGTVVLFFDHNVAGEEVVTHEYIYTCEAGYNFSVIRLQYYTSNFVLHRDDGFEYHLDEVHYRELGIEKTHSLTLLDVPTGNYTSLSFIYGLDEATNVDGGLPNTLTNINMEWPLVGDQGYHYMKFEGKYKITGTGETKAFNLHTGATDNNQNYIEVNIPLNNLNINDNTWHISLMMDLNEWLQNPNTWDFEFWGPMIMANQDAQLMLKANGATVFSVASMEVE